MECAYEEEGEGRVRSRSIAHPFSASVTAAVSGSASQRVRSSRVLGGVVETPLSVESVAVWSCRWLGGERGGERYGPLSEPAPLRGGPRSRLTHSSFSSPSPTRSCRSTGEPRRTVRGRVESSGGTVRELERRMRVVPCSCVHTVGVEGRGSEGGLSARHGRRIHLLTHPSARRRDLGHTRSVTHHAEPNTPVFVPRTSFLAARFAPASRRSLRAPASPLRTPFSAAAYSGVLPL